MCKSCGKSFHKAADCWEYNKKKYKWPSGYKTPGEKGISSTNEYGSITELLLMSVYNSYEFGCMKLSDDMSFASDTSILSDLNVFIAHIGETSDTTTFFDSLKMLRKQARKIQ